MQELDILSSEIQRLQELILDSDKKLLTASGSDKTRELYHSANLHFELRKIINIANETTNRFYCGGCGKSFNKREWRDKHSRLHKLGK